MKYDICVFGGCCIDQTFFQNDDGNYPDIPQIRVPGGKGSNQAVAAARAGAKVTIITRLGNDKEGYDIKKNLEVNGVDTSNVELVDGLQNDTGEIYIDKNANNDIKRKNGAIDSFTPEMVEKYAEVLLNSKIIVAQFKMPKEVSRELINFCAANNIMLIITPSTPSRLRVSEPGNLELINKISIITANEDECKTIFETDDIEGCVRKYPNKLIATLGKNGLMYSNGSEIIKLPAIRVDKVVDSTGAGDTFNGNLAAFLSEGDSLDSSIDKARYASALKIQQETAQKGMPYREDLEAFIRRVEHEPMEI
ncbi:MAG: PfkB family carbohydrate kinase [Oscillospiraceae bacterium]|nr:PfkB family carbohydrate kinase [Oscillospiraceae bacterium]